MKLKYMGTAAAEGLPGLFCECENCRRSRELGGRNIRSRSQAVVDNALLIDFPADTFMHFINNNLPLTKIKHCIITHSHADHLYPKDLAMRKKGYSNIFEDNSPITFYADAVAFNMIAETKGANYIKDEEMQVKKINAFVPFMAGEYKVTPLRANHSEITTPLIYLIEKDGKSLLYGHDTGLFTDETMAYLKNIEKPINLISLDCTSGCNPTDPNGYGGHMNVDDCEYMREELKKIGAADESTIFVLNHFSHNAKNVVYDDFSKIAKEKGFETSYDGMEIEF